MRMLRIGDGRDRESVSSELVEGSIFFSFREWMCISFFGKKKEFIVFIKVFLIK